MPIARAHRRAFLGALPGLAAMGLWPGAAFAHDAHAAHGQPVKDAVVPMKQPEGPVTDRAPVGAIPLQLADGRKANLQALLRGQLTAVQLMFTGCGTTCLVQGALFAQVQEQLRARQVNARLLSISIDALGDDAKGLDAWLTKFGAQRDAWTAAVPELRGVERMLSAFQLGSAQDAVPHLNRVFLFDRRGAMTWATAVDPQPAQVTELLSRRA
ncbi:MULTISPECIES: SCO family protein [unclassified Variovorax]|uniref:SCO family protein n=1 Tax=unclassified Variovorax TaxID=663243 RepID=UPI0008CF730A|nr:MULTISPECIES: SCO family protein [unclassified Variovorax]SEK11593.1 protein SCO1/2 [Variovorax sp. OK202]SFD75433.1 protein SCO1/2 [Variovorax sp. OK212]